MRLRKLVVLGLAKPMLDDVHWKQLATLADTVVHSMKPDPAELAEADGLIVGFAVPVDRAMIEAMPSLRYLGVASTAFDVVDLEYARGRGVVTTTLPAYMTEPVAQFVIATMLEQASGLVEGRAQRAEGNFSPLAYPARQFSGSNLGVVGLGTIGRRVAELGQGLGAHVAHWSRTPKPDFPYQELASLLAWADFVAVNLALTSDTMGIVSASALRPGTVFVSASPMAVLDRPSFAARTDLRAVCNHAMPSDVAELNLVTPSLVYLTPQAHAVMQDRLVANLSSA